MNDRAKVSMLASRERERAHAIHRSVGTAGGASSGTLPPGGGAGREGVVLVVILGMLALLSLVGVLFVSSTSEDLAAARAVSDSVTKADPPPISLDRVLEQVVFDTDNPLSALRGHSLLRDLWGNDVVGRYVDDGGVSVFRPGWVVDDAPLTATAEIFAIVVNLDPSAPIPTNPPVVPTAGEYLVGRHVVFKQSSLMSGQHAEIVEAASAAAPATVPATILQPGSSDVVVVRVSPPLPTVPGRGDQVLILQRPFNGTGDRDLSDSDGDNQVDDSNELPLYPNATLGSNFVFNVRHPEMRLDPVRLTDGADNDGDGVIDEPDEALRPIGGFDEPWDMADLQNLFLASIAADGTVNLPSFHRFAAPADWRNTILDVPGGPGYPDGVDDNGDTVPDDDAELVGYTQILRPRPVDQRLPGANGVMDDPFTLPAGYDDIPHPGFDDVFGTIDDLAPGPNGTYDGVPVAARGAPGGEPVGDDEFFERSFPMTGAGPDGMHFTADDVPDVDNLGDGVPDSIWLDVGLPIETRPDGTRAKPLAAILVCDLDGLLNLNVHGNNAAADSTAVAQGVDRDLNGTVDAGSTADAVLVHASNLGASPGEINLSRGLYSPLYDGLDNDGDTTIDELDEHELADGLNNDAATDPVALTDEADESEFLAVLYGREHVNAGLVPGRYGERDLLDQSVAPPDLPRAGLTIDPSGTVAPMSRSEDDDQDWVLWRRFGTVPSVPTWVDGDIDSFIDDPDELRPLNKPDNPAAPDNAYDAGPAVRRLMGLPDFNGDAFYQLRPWNLTRWGTIRNEYLSGGGPVDEDTRDSDPGPDLMLGTVDDPVPPDQKAVPTPVNRWAGLYENSGEQDEVNPYRSYGYDGRYTLADLEWLWRGHDMGGDGLTSRLAHLAPRSLFSSTAPVDPLTLLPPLQAEGVIRRRHFTTLSWDRAEYGLMPDIWRDAAFTIDPRGLHLDVRGADASVGFAGFSTLVSGTFDGNGRTPDDVPGDGWFSTDVAPPLDRLVPAPDLARGLRLNLNRPLGNGIDDDGNDDVDELDSPIDELVGDGFDNDADLSIDEPDELINDGIDNDGDGAYWTSNGLDDDGDLVIDNPEEGTDETYVSAGPGTPNGIDDDGNGFADDPPELAEDNLTPREMRQIQALNLYLLLRQIALPNDDGTQIDDTDKLHLAQIAANIVDMRDPDNEMTRLEIETGDVVWGVEHMPVVLTEGLIFIDEEPDPMDGTQGIVNPMDPGDVFVELYNTGHPNRPTVTSADLAAYRLVLSKDTPPGDNEPDDDTTYNSGPFAITITGGNYVVAGSAAAPPNGVIDPGAQFVDVSATLKPQVTFQFLSADGGDEWKVFLQRLAKPGVAFDATTNPYVTVDQLGMRVWVLLDGTVTDHMGGNLVSPELEQRGVDIPAELVSRERREPYRAEPNNVFGARPNNYVDPVTMLPFAEPNDATGGPAVRNHPNAGSGQDVPDDSHSLGRLNWNSDVDDQNGDHRDTVATTNTKPIADTMDNDGDGMVDEADEDNIRFLDGDLVDLNDPNGADDDADTQVDELGDNPADVQRDGVPSVAWTPVPPDDPNDPTMYVPSRAIAMDFLPWLDRDYANAGELLLVPGVAAKDLTAVFRNSGLTTNTYGYLADFFEQETAIAVPRGLHRLLEFVEVPSRQNGSADPDQPTSTDDRNRRVPGKINVNTISDDLVFRGLLDHPATDYPLGAPAAAFTTLQTSLNGADGLPGTQDDKPFVFGAQDRSLSLLRDDLNVGGMFAMDDNFDPFGTARLGDYRNPWFKYELLRKISSNVTNRSNTFAVWVTVGYFEVLDENPRDLDGSGTAGDQPFEFLPALGREVGSASGRQVRHRGFYVIDRSRSVGFDPDLKGTLDDIVLYRAIIE